MIHFIGQVFVSVSMNFIVIYRKRTEKHYRVHYVIMSWSKWRFWIKQFGQMSSCKPSEVKLPLQVLDVRKGLRAFHITQ